jgi:hypothetical protein
VFDRLSAQAAAKVATAVTRLAKTKLTLCGLANN